MEILRKYGALTDIYFPLIKVGGNNFAVAADFTHAAGDTKISKDGGAAGDTTNAPSAIVMGNGAMWKLTLTATEMQAAKISITVIDAATKAVEDQMIILSTYGNASAEHEFDLDTAAITVVGVRSEMDTNSTKLANLDATVSSRSTYAGGAVASVTAGVTVSTNNDKTGYSISGTKTTLDALNDITAAQVNSEADTALADYDPPTRTEATSDKNAIISEIQTQVNEQKNITVEIAGTTEISDD